MQHTPKTVTIIVKGCLTMHNIIRKSQPLQPAEVDAFDRQGNLIPGQWRQRATLTDNRTLRGNHTTFQAKIQRNNLSDYYNNPIGAVPWQDRAVQLNPLPPRNEESSSDSGSEPDSSSDDDNESEVMSEVDSLVDSEGESDEESEFESEEEEDIDPDEESDMQYDEDSDW